MAGGAKVKIRITMRLVARLAAFLLVVFLALQFVRPDLKNPPVTAELQAPPAVKQILRSSCYNCHSNETELPWFDKIVPAYWLVVRDVRQARMHLNFSEIGARPAAQQKGTLFEAVNQIQMGAMPLPSYRRVHPGATVTAGQLRVLRDYLNSLTPTAAASANDVASADAEYARWIATGSQPRQVRTALNGIAFLPEYRNWKAISSTDRFDNQTIRVVLGNDVAVRAVAAKQTNPWPDGTAFAKVAWFQEPNEQGVVRPGAFQQVEFMIKDSHKYASTLGWGWGRWRGVDLQPYGATADFASECVGCHTPLRRSDYVFTEPINRKLGGNLSDNPLDWRVITTSIDKRAATMSTLFGNDAAVEYARTSAGQNYPSGAVLSLVTWKQREDGHWFGARVPAAPVSVEFVRPGDSGARAADLLSRRAAVMP